MEKSKIFKGLGVIFLTFFILALISPVLIMPISAFLGVCEGWNCAGFVIIALYSPILLFISLIFFALVKYTKAKNNKDEMLVLISDKRLIIEIIAGIVLISGGFLLNNIKELYNKYGLFNYISIIIGIFFLLSGIIQLLVKFLKQE